VGRARAAPATGRGGEAAVEARAHGIEARVTTGLTADGGRAVAAEVGLVPRVEIESASFVLVQISYEGPSSDEIRGSARARSCLAAAIAGTILLITLPLADPSAGPPSEHCRHQAPWGRVALACHSERAP
jgi:hypothetical protein